MSRYEYPAGLGRPLAAGPRIPMCFDPATVLFTVGATKVSLGTAAFAASTLMSVVGAISQGNHAQATSEYNARVAERDALAARQWSNFEEKKQRDQARRFLSSQKAAIGASGVTLAGSPLLVTEETAQQAEIDALAIRYSGTVEAARANARAAGERLQGASAQTAGYIRAGGSLLTGIGRISRNLRLDNPKVKGTEEDD